MMNSKQLRMKAWDSLKGKYWMALLVTIVLGLLGSLGTGAITLAQNMINIVTAVDPAEMDQTAQVGAIVILCASMLFAIIGFLLSLFIGSAATVGMNNYFIKNTYSTPTFADAFSGFKVCYKRNIWALLLVAIRSVLWTFLFIIPGIIKMYEYSMIPYILADDAEISTKDAFKKSKEMMTGNKWRLFKLEFSFIGWALLSVFTCGVGTFFLMPYICAANAEFYTELKNK